MKLAPFFLCATILIAPLTPVWAQDSPAVTRLKEVDKLIAHPLNSRLVTDGAYSKAIHKEQAKSAGMAVTEGKIIGTSASSNDKGVTLNIGLTPSSVDKSAHGISVVFTAKAMSEDGFVKVFSDAKYQKTLSGGATLIFFLKSFKSFYEEDKNKIYSEIALHRAAELTAWTDGSYLPPVTATTIAMYDSKVAAFKVAWRGLVHHLTVNQYLDDYYDNGITKAMRKDDELQRLYKEYLLAESTVLTYLPDNWYGFTGKTGFRREKTFVQTNFVHDSANYVQYRTAIINKETTAKRKVILSESAAYYDAIQAKANWAATSHFAHEKVS